MDNQGAGIHLQKQIWAHRHNTRKEQIDVLRRHQYLVGLPYVQKSEGAHNHTRMHFPKISSAPSEGLSTSRESARCALLLQQALAAKNLASLANRGDIHTPVSLGPS